MTTYPCESRVDYVCKASLCTRRRESSQYRYRKAPNAPCSDKTRHENHAHTRERTRLAPKPHQYQVIVFPHRAITSNNITVGYKM